MLALAIGLVILWFQPRYVFMVALALAVLLMGFPFGAPVDAYPGVLISVGLTLGAFLLLATGVIETKRWMLRRETRRMEGFAEAALKARDETKPNA